MFYDEVTWHSATTFRFDEGRVLGILAITKEDAGGGNRIAYAFFPNVPWPFHQQISVLPVKAPEGLSLLYIPRYQLWLPSSSCSSCRGAIG